MKKTLFFLLALVGPQGIYAATLRVPEEYRTIQAALDAASDGDIVDVAPGHYMLPHVKSMLGFNYSLVIDKAVTLRSRKLYQAILDGRGDSTVLILVRAAARIEGFILQKAFKGIQQRGSPDVTWTGRNLIIRDMPTGTGIEINDEFTRIGSAVLSNITVNRCDVAFATNDAHSFLIFNTIVANCHVGFGGYDHDSFTVTHSLLHNVDVRDSSDTPITYGAGMLFGTDPHFRTVTGGPFTFPLFPQCESLAIDSGNPGAAFSDAFPATFGGRRNDIGAYGGPAGAIGLSPSQRWSVLLMDPGDRRCSWKYTEYSNGSYVPPTGFFLDSTEDPYPGAYYTSRIDFRLDAGNVSSILDYNGGGENPGPDCDKVKAYLTLDQTAVPDRWDLEISATSIDFIFSDLPKPKFDVESDFPSDPDNEESEVVAEGTVEAREYFMTTYWEDYRDGDARDGGEIRGQFAMSCKGLRCLSRSDYNPCTQSFPGVEITNKYGNKRGDR